MRLNLPIIDQLASCESLLIAGMGGGFDLFCGLPIYFELRHRGKEARLASFTSRISLRWRTASVCRRCWSVWMPVSRIFAPFPRTLPDTVV